MEILDDERYMRRALQLAANGRGHVSPNPMVGAVVVAPGGRIIGEGWHRHYGGPHAEVNAINSIGKTDMALLPECTMYVTLEPCSHWGKTPPCAKLLVDSRVGHVVVGAGDPNPKVSGRGIALLQQAGIEVRQGVLARESIALNKTFMTAQTLRRPFVTLKWAQSADGFMASSREHKHKFSTAANAVLVHSRRACHDAILVGACTVLCDKPALNVRHVEGRNPLPVVLDRQKLLADSDLCFPAASFVHITDDMPLQRLLEKLYSEHGITSVLVEGGASVLQQFIDAGLFDEIYVETSPQKLGDNGSTTAPLCPCGR